MQKIIPVLFSILLLSISSYAHDCGSSCESEVAELDAFFEQMLIETKGSSEYSEGSRIVFEAPDGSRVAVRRSDVSKVMINALRHYYAANPEKIPGPAELFSWVELAKSIGGLPQRLFDNLKWLMTHPRTAEQYTAVFLHYVIPDFINHSIPRFVKVRSSDAVQFAKEMGYLPAVVIGSLVLTTWLPYTALTEFIEHSFVGPFAILCQAFQVVYWGTVYKLASVFIGADTFLRRSMAFLRAGYVSAPLKALSLMNMDLANKGRLKRLLVESSNMVFRYNDFKKMKDLSSPLQVQLAGHGYWSENHASMHNQNVSWSRVAVESEISAHQDAINALEVLLNLYSTKISSREFTPDITWKQLLAEKFYIGGRLKDLRRISSALKVHKVASGTELADLNQWSTFESWKISLYLEVIGKIDATLEGKIESTPGINTKYTSKKAKDIKQLLKPGNACHSVVN